jgi:hypothetical protein
MTIAGFILIALTPRGAVPLGSRPEELAFYIVLQAALAGMGALLALRQPRNVIGWLLSIAGVVTALEFASAGYAIHGFHFGALPRPDLAAWIYSWTGSLIGVPVGVIVVIFPDGRPRSRAGWAALLLFPLDVALLVVGLALRPGPMPLFPTATNPFGWTGHTDLLDAMLGLAAVCTVLIVTLVIKQLVDRMREAKSVERQQIKWFLWGCVSLALATSANFPFIMFSRTNDVWRYVAQAASALAMATLPLAIAIAILRYRLYDIDTLINRTAVYAATTGTIAATFWVGIVALQPLFWPLTSGTELAVAASTLVSFALFQPVRRRIQDAVDRRFDRSRYDASRTLDAFADRLRDEVDLDALRADLLGAVRGTMAPAHVSLWLRAEHRNASGTSAG